MIIWVFHIYKVVFIMTCCETTQENFKEHLEGNEGEVKVKSYSFVEIKEESMPDPEKEKEEERMINKTSENRRL